MKADPQVQAALLVLVSSERARQDQLHGFDIHRLDGTGLPDDVEEEHVARAAYEAAKQEGRVTWRLVLREEVAEVNAAGTALRQALELLQVSASALKWLEAMVARGSVTAEQLAEAQERKGTPVDWAALLAAPRPQLPEVAVRAAPEVAPVPACGVCGVPLAPLPGKAHTYRVCPAHPQGPWTSPTP